MNVMQSECWYPGTKPSVFSSEVSFFSVNSIISLFYEGLEVKKNKNALANFTVWTYGKP